MPAGTFGFTSVAGTPVDPILNLAARIFEGSTIGGTNAVQFVVSRTGGSDGAVDVSYQFRPGGTDAADFVGGLPANGVLSFANGETEKIITLNVATDFVIEQNESPDFQLLGATNGGVIDNALALGRLVIDNDDESANLLTNSGSVTEGDRDATGAQIQQVVPITFTRTDGGTAAVAFDYATSDATARSTANGNDPADYVATSGRVVFAAGQTSVTINVTVLGDYRQEGNESFSLSLTQVGAGAASATNVVTILDNGDLAGGAVYATGATIVEGNSGQTQAVVTLRSFDDSPPQLFSDFFLTVADGRPGFASATRGSDYGAVVAGPNAFYDGAVGYVDANQTGSLLVTINGDTTFEPDEALTLNFTQRGTARIGTPTVYVTIQNDDAAPTPVPPGVPAPSGNYTVNGQAYIDRDYVAPMGDRVDAIFVQDGSTTNAINITGNAASQTITGNNGANIINGLGGADTMTGLGGNDQYLVRGPGDVVIEANGGGTDTVFTTVSYNLGANEVEVLSTVTNSDTTAIDLTGNFATQTIIGNYGNNVLNGGSGGLDTLIGLRGNDVYVVGDSRTVIVENAGEGADTVVTSVDYTLAAGVSVEVLAAQDRAGTTSLALRGNEIAQTIVGNNGANVLDGGLGSDTLAGGGGADSFRFTTALGANNIDSVVDFESIDKIGLSAGIFGLTAVTATNFTIGAAATTADQRIVYNQATGQLFFDADGNGAGAAVLFAMFAPNTVLAAANFEIV